jgi:hypothetical protein
MKTSLEDVCLSPNISAVLGYHGLISLVLPALEQRVRGNWGHSQALQREVSQHGTCWRNGFEGRGLGRERVTWEHPDLGLLLFLQLISLMNDFHHQNTFYLYANFDRKCLYMCVCHSHTQTHIRTSTPQLEPGLQPFSYFSGRVSHWIKILLSMASLNLSILLANTPHIQLIC